MFLGCGNNLFAFAILACLGAIFVDDSSAGAGSDWCYLNPSCDPKHWGGVCASGKAQSPINLEASKATPDQGVYPINESKDYCGTHDDFNIRNNGHSIEVHLNDEAKSINHAYSGKGFSDYYVFAQVHFHWGPTDETGSEHAIEGKRYALEMHFVHKKYDHLKKTFYEGTGPDLLAVIGVLFKVGGADNPSLEPIINVLSKVNKTKAADIINVKATKINFFDVLPKGHGIYRYSGSLTTPGCDESVLWTVFKDPVTMSKRQIEAFRSVLTPDGKQFGDNCRPVQPLNGRKLEQFTMDIKCTALSK